MKEKSLKKGPIGRDCIGGPILGGICWGLLVYNKLTMNNDKQHKYSLQGLEGLGQINGQGDNETKISQF